MIKKVLWVIDLCIAVWAMYWVGDCVGTRIGDRIPEVFGTNE